MVRLNLSHSSLRPQLDTQQRRLQSLFNKRKTKCNKVMQAPQIKEIIKRKIIIRNIKERIKLIKEKIKEYKIGWNTVLSLP
jgi:hypothetical protein